MECLMTTGPSFEGYRITGYYGIITAESLVNPAIKNQETKWDSIRNETYEKLSKKLPQGANAIIGIEVAHNHFQGVGLSSLFYFFATGTAVSIEKI